MSIHPKKLSMDNLSDNSDILSILESIETMFDVCRKVHNSYTQASLMLSITTEAEMLLLKLRVMQDRWKTHLPFKEASTIDFYRWATKIEQMAIAVGGTDQAHRLRRSHGLQANGFCLFQGMIPFPLIRLF